MLLHEMGHVLFDDETTEQTLLEIKADDFAAQQIKSAATDPSFTRSTDALWISIELGRVSWNLMSHRLLDNFGATAVADKRVFGDKGLSHPNLEWRILRMNAEIQDSPATRELLDSFETKRRQSALPQEPLYIER